METEAEIMQFYSMENAHKQLDKAISLRYSDTPESKSISDFLMHNCNEADDIFHAALLNSTYCQFLLSEETNLLENLYRAYDYFTEEHHPNNKARACAYLSNIYDNFGELDRALEKALEGISISNHSDNLEVIAHCYSSAGNVYSRLGQLELALSNYETALKFRISLNDKSAQASSYNLIGKTLCSLEKYGASIESYEKSLALRIELNETSSIPWTYMGMAYAYKAKGDLGGAKNLFSSTLKQLNTQSTKRVECYLHIGLGAIHVAEQNWQAAEMHLTSAFEIATSLKAETIKTEILPLQIELNENIGNWRKAIELAKQLILLTNEQNSRKVQQQIAHLQKSFEITAARKEMAIVQEKNAELEVKNKEINDSIRYALRIQQAILPDEDDIRTHLPSFKLYFKPKDIVSGDYFWFYHYEKTQLSIIVAADCTGHGVPGGFMSMIGSDRLNRIIIEKGITEPDEILHAMHLGITQALNQHDIGSTSKDGMEMGICVINKANGKLSFAGVGRPLLCMNINNELIEIKPTKSSIGGHSYELSIDKHEFNLNDFKLFCMYSDGIPDQFGGPNQKKFSSKRLRTILEENAFSNSIAHTFNRLEADFDNWKEGQEQTDDMLLMLFSV